MIRRILSHGLLITIIALAVIGYLYRAQLFPDLYQDAAEEGQPSAVAPVEPGQESPAAARTTPAPERQQSVAGQASQAVREPGPMPPVSDVAKASQPVPAPVAAPRPEASAVASKTVVEPVQPRMEPAGRAPGYPPMAPPPMMVMPGPTMRPMPQAPTPARPKPEPTTAAAETSPGPGPAPGATETQPPAAPQPGPSTTVAKATVTPATPSPSALPEATPTESGELLNRARAAYWRQDYASAERDYQAAAQREPQNPDAYGELGNVYYAQGKWQEAGQAYVEAATRLLAQGHKSQAMQLHRVIQGLDADSAAELERRLAEARE